MQTLIGHMLCSPDTVVDIRELVYISAGGASSSILKNKDEILHTITQPERSKVQTTVWGKVKFSNILVASSRGKGIAVSHPSVVG